MVCSVYSLFSSSFKVIPVEGKHDCKLLFPTLLNAFVVLQSIGHTLSLKHTWKEQKQKDNCSLIRSLILHSFIHSPTHTYRH